MQNQNRQTNNVKDLEQRKRQYDRRRILYLDTASSGWERQHCQSSLSNALFAPTFGFGFDAWIETGLFASSGSASGSAHQASSIIVVDTFDRRGFLYCIYYIIVYVLLYD